MALAGKAADVLNELLVPATDTAAADWADLDRLVAPVERAQLRASLHDFVRYFWPLVEPQHPFVDNWHIRAVCRVLEEISTTRARREQSNRVVLNVPPGTTKSLLISVFYPCWRWASNPRLRFLLASYGQHLTTRDNLRARQILTSPQFQSLFKLGLVEDQNTKTRYDTTERGWRIATSVGGVGTGEHPHVIVIDDPTTAEQAKSDADRQAANDWFDSTMSTRGVAWNVTVIVVMQRLHANDLSGHLLKRGGVKHVCFPMRFEPARPKTDQEEGFAPDPLDERAKPGELLWPALYDEAKVKKMELDLGPIDALAQMQQQPTGAAGLLFQRVWFNVTTVAPKPFDIRRMARGWDTAATEGGGDWTAGVKMAELKDGRVFVLDVRRAQLGPAGVDELITKTAIGDGPFAAQREEKEGGSAGAAVVQARAKKLRGYDYAGVAATGNKVTKAKPFRAQVEARNVWVLDREWTEAYLDELVAFPTGSHDDQVDGSSVAYNELVAGPSAVLIGGTDFGVKNETGSPFSFGVS